MQFHFIWALVNQLGGAVLGGILTQIGFALTDLGNPGASHNPPAMPCLRSFAGGHRASSFLSSSPSLWALWVVLCCMHRTCIPYGAQSCVGRTHASHL